MLCNCVRQNQCILLAPTLNFLVNNAEEMSMVLPLQRTRGLCACLINVDRSTYTSHRMFVRPARWSYLPPVFVEEQHDATIHLTF